MTLVRQSSPVGPCLTLGEFTRKTEKFMVYKEWLGGTTYSEKETRIAKGRVHLVPCRCCRDHETTMYPFGYMD